MTLCIFEIDGVLYNEETGEICMHPKYKGELIRCKECRYKHIEKMVWVCPFGLPSGEDFYCGYGKRKEE